MANSFYGIVARAMEIVKKRERVAEVISSGKMSRLNFGSLFFFVLNINTYFIFHLREINRLDDDRIVRAIIFVPFYDNVFILVSTSCILTGHIITFDTLTRFVGTLTRI